MTQHVEMVENLERIAARLSNAGREVASKLQTGLSAREIASWEARLPFLLTREIEALFQWRNGTNVVEGDLLGHAYFFPGYYLLSIEEAVETYEERRGTQQWKDEWFPVCADGGGDFYVVPCSGDKLDVAPVIGFLHGEPEQTVDYESLSAMMQTIEACYAEGAFFVDDDGELEVDDDKHQEIAHRFNPEVEEWQS
ncbi:MAG: SMI1/KNR4 family protein [Nannocystaceae bacterium]